MELGTKDKKPGLGRGAAIVAVTLLSFGPAIVKKVEIAAAAFVFWRLLVSAVPLAIFLVGSRRRITFSDLRAAALGGFVFGLNLIVGVLSLRRTSALHHMVIMSLQPLGVLLISIRFFGERPRMSVYFYSLIAFCGVTLTLLATDASGVAGLSGGLLSAVAMTLYTLYFAISKKARESLDSPTYQFLLVLVALLTSVPFLLVLELGIPIPSGSDWWLVVAMAFLPGTGHLLTNFAHGHTSLTLVGLMNLGLIALVPLTAWWLIGERVGGVQAIGAGITIASLAMIVNKAPSGPAERPVN